MTNEYRVALAEVNEVLKRTDIKLIRKIPYKFRRNIVKNMDKEVKVNIKNNKSVDEQDISEAAKEILAVIYRDYFVDQNTREELIDKEKIYRQEVEKIKQEKYKSDDLFADKKKAANNLPISIDNEHKSILTRFFNWVKSKFSK